MPAFTLAHGILGLEGIHRLSDEIDINTQTGLPRIEVDRITGIHALPEADDNREANFGRGGEQTYPSLVRGKTITYEGRILGRDIWQLRALTTSFRHAAAAGRFDETGMVVRPHPTIGGVSWRYDARVLALECDDEQTVGVEAMPTAYQRGFVLTLRQSKGRYFAVGQDVSASGTSGQVLAVTNVGNAPAGPVFLVNGPASDLTFLRQDNFIERRLIYQDVPLASGQQAMLDYDNRIFRRVSDGTSLEYTRLFDESNWFDPGAAGLNPGTTHLTVTGGGTWSVTFAPAGW